MSTGSKGPADDKATAKTRLSSMMLAPLPSKSSKYGFG